MNATATTARPVPTELHAADLEAELDRLLAVAEPRPITAAASPLCLCWPDADE